MSGWKSKHCTAIDRTSIILETTSNENIFTCYPCKKDCIDTEIRDKNGRLAIDLARARYYTDIVDYIERFNKNRKNTFCNLKYCYLKTSNSFQQI